MSTLRLPAGGLTVRAVVASRLLVLAAGVCGALVGPVRVGHVASNLRTDLGTVGNVLAGPVFRGDAGWYLAIAQHGYGHAGVGSRAFWPVYPFLIRLLTPVTGSGVIAGVAISLISFVAALVLLHRLTELELGRPAADTTALLLAFAPLSFFFSAAYTESLFLLLSVGAIFAARKERWALACALAGVATLTRPTGITLLIPIAIMLWRSSRGPDRRLAWLLLVPAALGAYLGGLALTGHSWQAPFQAQAVWHKVMTGPLGGIALAAFQALVNGARIVGGSQAIYDPSRFGPLTPAAESILLVLWAVLGIVLVIACFRRLPLHYGAYAAATLIVCLSDPEAGQPLVSLDRYLLTLFPLWMVAGVWITERRLKTAALVAGSIVLAFYTFWFARYAFVA
jgi:Mannosyltransferase (PIG-V)